MALKFKIGEFDPKPTKYPFPEQTDVHYLTIKKDNGIKVDENYPYIDKSKKFKRGDTFLWLLIALLGRIIIFFATGLKIINKKNIKKYKKELSHGAISVSNHMHLYDFLGIQLAIKPFRAKTIVWYKNVIGESTFFVRHIGGVPIPENNVRAYMNFAKDLNTYIKDNGWVHVYPEGSMWEYYKPIRPFKSGAAHLAIKNNVPILPLAFSYKKPSFIRKYIFRQEAKIILNIGEPIFPNLNIDKKVAEKELTIKLHNEVCRLAGIDQKENIYNPIFNDDKRIDYYTSKYGK